MPVGKESIKRAAGGGTRKAAAKKAPGTVETVIAAPAEEVIEKVVKPASKEERDRIYGIGDALPFYLW